MTKTKKQSIKKIDNTEEKKGSRHPFSDWRFLIISIFAFVVVVIVLVIVILLPDKSNDSQDTSTPETEDEILFRHPLNGEPTDQEIKPFVYGVVVENMVESRPQSGLEDSSLVIEAPVEGGITRFLAFYSDEQEVEEIGPVRSARPYFIDWNEEFDAMFVHVGGSPEALDLISTFSVLDLNEFTYTYNFWRNHRLAPHNVYTSIGKLDSALVDREERIGEIEYDYESWEYKLDAEFHERPDWSPVVTIEYSTPAYQLAWRYDKEFNAYERLQSGVPHKMANSEVIWANNIAIMETDITILDEIGRRRIRTTGSGGATVLIDGQVIEGIWQKNDRDSRLRFYDAEGEEIIWNAGTTWIQVIGPSHVLEIEESL